MERRSFKKVDEIADSGPGPAQSRLFKR